MLKKAIPVAMAATLILTMAGCSGNNRGGGGGGNTMSENRSTTQTTTTRTEEQNQAHTAPGAKVSNIGKDFADAYSRVAWVHADIIAKDWDRAKDDLKHVDSKLNDLLKNKDLPSNAKTSITALKSDVTKLNNSIMKHEGVAAVQAKALINRFATELNMAPTVAWFGEKKGGGAGTGVKSTVQHPVKATEKGAHTVKTKTETKTNEMKHK